MIIMDTLRKRGLLIVAGTFALGCLASVIVDFAINRALTWSWIVIGGCALAMLAVFPALCIRPRPIPFMLMGLSIGVIPYLALIDWALDDMHWFAMGVIISLFSIAYAWFAYVIITRAKWNWKFRSGVLVVGAGVLNFSVNTIVSNELLFWRLLSFVVMVTIGIMLMTTAKHANA